MRTVLYEVYTFHQIGKGVPFIELLETLLANKLGAAALTLDVRIKREKELADIFTFGAHVRAQAIGRGFLQRCRTRKLRAARGGSS